MCGGPELQDRWTGRGGLVCKIDLAVGFRATLSFGPFICVSKEKYETAHNNERIRVKILFGM
jgi:hypothetical protein